MRWLTFGWYSYLFHKYKDKNPTMKMIICRAFMHKAGPVWYNLSGLEPNMNCKNCGENLG